MSGRLKVGNDRGRLPPFTTAGWPLSAETPLASLRAYTAAGGWPSPLASVSAARDAPGHTLFNVAIDSPRSAVSGAGDLLTVPATHCAASGAPWGTPLTAGTDRPRMAAALTRQGIWRRTVTGGFGSPPSMDSFWTEGSLLALPSQMGRSRWAIGASCHVGAARCSFAAYRASKFAIFVLEVPSAHLSSGMGFAAATGTLAPGTQMSVLAAGATGAPLARLHAATAPLSSALHAQTTMTVQGTQGHPIDSFHATPGHARGSARNAPRPPPLPPQGCGLTDGFDGRGF